MSSLDDVAIVPAGAKELARSRPIGEEGDDEIIDLAPLRKKPKIEASGASSGLLSRISAFLPQMKAADDDLEAKREAGLLGEMNFEIDEDDSESESEDDSSSSRSSSSSNYSSSGLGSRSDLDPGSDSDSDPDSDSDSSTSSGVDSSHYPEILNVSSMSPKSTADAEANQQNKNNVTSEPPFSPPATSPPKRPKKKRKISCRKERSYIEMNLGLGVLEEKPPGSEKLDANIASAGVARFLGLAALVPSNDDSDTDTSSSNSRVKPLPGQSSGGNEGGGQQLNTKKRRRPVIEEID